MPLPFVAMGWVLLYGFAVSAAAFAGERENDTLAFLDMLPVGRKVLPVEWKAVVRPRVDDGVPGRRCSRRWPGSARTGWSYRRTWVATRRSIRRRSARPQPGQWSPRRCSRSRRKDPDGSDRLGPPLVGGVEQRDDRRGPHDGVLGVRPASDPPRLGVRPGKPDRVRALAVRAGPGALGRLVPADHTRGAAEATAGKRPECGDFGQATPDGPHPSEAEAPLADVQGPGLGVVPGGLAGLVAARGDRGVRGAPVLPDRRARGP